MIVNATLNPHYVEKISFARFIQEARVNSGDDAADLIAALRKQENMPREFRTLDDFRQFLIWSGFAKSAVDAAEVVWRRYEVAAMV